ncbi:MAG: FIG01042815: hypothetical protein, partial [uncultured Thermoleophilia bacterium]
AQPPAAALLRRQRRLPLPGPGVRRAAVRPGRRPRRRVAADRHRRCGVLPVAPAVAGGRVAGARRPAAPAGLGRRAGAHERVLLPRHRGPAARDGGGHRVPARHRARRPRRPDPAQRRRARARGPGGVPPHGRQAHRGARGRRPGLRQRGALRRLHRPRPPDRADAGAARHRRPGGGHGRRRGRGDAARGGAGAARPDGSRGAAGGPRCRDLLVGDPVRRRPARAGAPGPRHLRAHGLAAAGDRDGHRRPRA